MTLLYSQRWRRQSQDAGKALILPKGRVQLFGDPANREKLIQGQRFWEAQYIPKDYNVQETEEDRAASQSAGPGLKKEAHIRQKLAGASR